jgi:hypothetical protein
VTDVDTYLVGRFEEIRRTVGYRFRYYHGNRRPTGLGNCIFLRLREIEIIFYATGTSLVTKRKLILTLEKLNRELAVLRLADRV